MQPLQTPSVSVAARFYKLVFDAPPGTEDHHRLAVFTVNSTADDTELTLLEGILLV